MQCACTVLSSVDCMALQYFSTLSHKWHDFQGVKNVTANEMCVLILSTTFVQNISHSKKNSARYDYKSMQVVFSLIIFSHSIGP
jgi:hypothetical protein